MKSRRMIWTIIFLGVTAVAILMEVVAGVFHPAGTIPWTEYLARYVPWPFQLAAYVILAVWLPFHFWRHDHLRKEAYRTGRGDGFIAGYRTARQQEKERAAFLSSAAQRTCSHGFVWGHPSGHICGEMSSGEHLGRDGGA